MIFSFTLLALCVSLVWGSPEGLLKVVPPRDIGTRIVNGDQAQEGQFPWQVSVLVLSSGNSVYLCSGALISDQWVLTAGHCVDGASSATIYSGSVTIPSPNATASSASEFYLHEGFDYITHNNDIGLIKLERAVTLDDTTQVIALAEEELAPLSNVTVSGWGQVSDDDPNTYSEVLNYITVSTMPNSLCAAYYGDVIVYDGLVCTGTGDPLKSPCLGDSGAPLVVDIDTKPVHVGIFIFVNSLSCEFSYPAGNSRTAYHREWIRNITGI